MNKAGVLLFTYECRLNEWLNVAIIGHQSANVDDWNAPVSMDDVLSVLQDGFNPAWSAIAKCAGPNEWKGFPISSRDPLDRLYKDKVVLVGDAGHAMLPTHAQGATMALEDAAALEVLFSNVQSGDEVVKRLEIFQQLRLPRSATTQLLSNAMLYFKDGGEVKERIRHYYKGDLPFGEDMWSENIQSFFYDYDIWAEAKKALGFLNHPNGVPDDTLKYFGTMKRSSTPAAGARIPGAAALEDETALEAADEEPAAVVVPTAVTDAEIAEDDMAAAADADADADAEADADADALAATPVDTPEEIAAATTVEQPKTSGGNRSVDATVLAALMPSLFELYQELYAEGSHLLLKLY
ncbi:hypothetical protein AMS68_005263 [Peltaster fructicola]|uniref:FAD-binding domain-containing protein n=1 Tax=Peltaster fructicola TaxID=286661 RepID=A0A6H0XYJ2_9PEZI|nr:hypothetical protein AMS68_005263 [Peltaster fructicola]